MEVTETHRSNNWSLMRSESHCPGPIMRSTGERHRTGYTVLLVMVSNRSASVVVLAVQVSRRKPVLAVMGAWPLEAREWRSNALVLIPIRAQWCSGAEDSRVDAVAGS